MLLKFLNNLYLDAIKFNLLQIEWDFRISNSEFSIHIVRIETVWHEGSLFHFFYYKFHSPLSKTVYDYDFLWAGLWLGKLLGE